jgi:hypothetical protein
MIMSCMDVFNENEGFGIEELVEELNTMDET